MTIDIKKNGDEVTLAIVGRLVVSEECDGASGVIMDMKELEYISSAGLRVLLGTHKKMQRVGFLRLTNVGESVMEVLEMTGFADILEIE